MKHIETERNKKGKDQNKGQNTEGDAKTDNMHARLCSVTFFVFLWFYHHFVVLVLFWLCFGLFAKTPPIEVPDVPLFAPRSSVHEPKR